MANFKGDCLDLQMDQSIILDDKTMSITQALLDGPSNELTDMHNAYSIDKSSPLLDLEKPIMNIIHVESIAVAPTEPRLAKWLTRMIHLLHNGSWNFDYTLHKT